MKAVSGTVMRSLDRRAIEEAGIPGERLMTVSYTHLRAHETD